MDRVAPAQVPAPFEEFERLVRDLATAEGRFVTSVVVVAVAGSLVAAAIPVLVQGVSRVFRDRVLPPDLLSVFDVVNAYLPTTLARLAVRTGQLVVLFVAGLALLVTWGLVDIAVRVVTVVVASLPFASQVTLTLVVFVVAYIAADVLQRLVGEFAADADRITAHQEEIMLRVGHVVILFVVTSGTLTLWGLDLSGLLVGAGAVGIVVGLAARQTIGGMIAGFVLMFTRPFTIGDWVEIGDHEGTVTQITVMHTKLRNFDGELVIIPNDVVSEQSIRNLSHQNSLRLHLEVGVDYDTDIEHAEHLAREAIAAAETVVDTPSPEVAPTRFGDSAVVLELLFWIEDPTPLDDIEATRSVIRELKSRFEEAGIKIPYPQRELSGRAETGGFRVRTDRGPAPGDPARPPPEVDGGQQGDGHES